LLQGKAKTVVVKLV